MTFGLPMPYNLHGRPFDFECSLLYCCGFSFGENFDGFGHEKPVNVYLNFLTPKVTLLSDTSSFEPTHAKNLSTGQTCR